MEPRCFFSERFLSCHEAKILSESEERALKSCLHLLCWNRLSAWLTSTTEGAVEQICVRLTRKAEEIEAVAKVV